MGELALTDLRRTLLRQDASILGAIWDDPSDLALAATATASTTLRTLSYEDDDAEPFALDVDVALVLPVEPSIAGVSLLLDADAATTVTMELWETGAGQNYLPVVPIAATEIGIPAGRDWRALPFEHTPPDARNVVLVVRAAEGVSLVTGSRRAPYGLLALTAREPRVRREDGLPQANAWDADPLRRRGVHLRVDRGTDAYDPAKVIGGYQRPFNGPQLWSSERMSEGREEWLQLEWPTSQVVGRVDVIFNDDVDEHLNNLHRDPKPFDVFPELVSDYRVEARTDGAWRAIATVEGNHHRRRVHSLTEPVHADAVRLVVERTNGSETAQISSIRVFAPESSV